MVNQGTLMEIFGVTNADLAFNRSGRLSDRQHVSERKRIKTMLTVGLAAVVVVALIFGVALAIITGSLPESVLVALVVLMVFEALIVWNYLRSMADIRDDRVESVRGIVRLEKRVRRRGGSASGSATSRQQSVTYHLHMDDETFPLSGQRYSALSEAGADGQTLTIYYQPRTRHVVAAES